MEAKVLNNKVNYFEWDGFPSKEKVASAMKEALKITERNLERIGSGFTGDETENGKYDITPNDRWTSGFLIGVLWIAYELTGDEKFRKIADEKCESMIDRINTMYMIGHHDMGFMYSPSCVASYMLTGNQQAKDAALKAADYLMTRFNPRGNFINAWAHPIEDEEIVRGANFLIVDSLFNIPLLYWASNVTGDTKYKDVAKKHLDTVLKYIVREDNSSYHAYFFDYDTGDPVRGGTAQGASDESCWARGQAWAIGGLALNYKETHDENDIVCFKKVLDYYIDHQPEDNVAFWDLIFTDGDDEPRDSSSAVIVLCAIMEMAKYLPEDDEDMIRYQKFAGKMFNSLIDNYAASYDMDCDGLLLHGTGSKPHNMGVDECNVWGDYFFMEAIVRCMKDWEIYW